MNSLEYEVRDMELQWNLWFRTKLQSGLDRSRMALWEVRNLNISSHIRRATALHPGERLLVIVGASHKPFLETYLNQMVDIINSQSMILQNFLLQLMNITVDSTTVMN